MTEPKKFFLDKSDDIDIAIQKIKRSRVKAEEYVINIPRDSVIGNSVANFEKLAVVCAKADKKVSIESVDDHILELASLAKIDAINPVFKHREHAVADVVPRGETHEVDENPVEEDQIAEEREIGMPPGRKNLGKLFFACAALALVLGGGYALANTILPRATVKISFKEVKVPFDGTLAVSSKAATASVNGSSVTVPGELLKATANVQMSFDAKGTAKVEEKAKGTITIWNTYGTAPQTLVATTRFESPDGKIFRITDKVVVPGEKTVNGKLVPASVDAAVIADASGEAYNLQPTPLWQIPGFKGKPQYGKFYGESKQAMSGGFVGERPAPTGEEIYAARAKVKESLANVLRSKLSVMYAEQFKLFDNASAFTVTKENITYPSDKPGSYNVFMDGEMSQLVFEEKSVRDALVASAKDKVPDGWKDEIFEVSYENPTVDTANGSMTLHTAGSIVFKPEVDVAAFTKDIAGKDEAEIKAMIVGLPGLRDIKISLWPFWVKRVPSNVSVSVE